jgi:hypothetical protein
MRLNDLYLEEYNYKYDYYTRNLVGRTIGIGFEVMLPSACSFIVDVSCSTLHV